MSYAELQVGVGWLKNFNALVEDAQGGITAADVALAEASADCEINSFFGRYYDIGAAAFATAPEIIEIAAMLGASRLIKIKFSRDGDANTSLAAALESDARNKMAPLRNGGLRDAAGNLIAPLARAITRVGNVS